LYFSRIGIKGTTFPTQNSQPIYVTYSNNKWKKKKERKKKKKKKKEKEKKG